ncbi:hypothetical protein SARC_02332 [Sphaeroforma arctica JP610]|uniref:Uncharacterized protein n=1 Tax=Sphaeroforma arctica JP610 TaxID=667725 RepID=A0A0L0G916_9EUKA|nr:hypothetical protein SARC_02332 [Sphaeroforma arctica JP610]KNC85495.1 hypothetical protein SARC_02332 [Sphaeroforma arctica JP610]|eukprot:XP_014159397.1 hypothetical protein SARC_02332 [Sphaeroforma arctica JP610]
MVRNENLAIADRLYSPSDKWHGCTIPSGSLRIEAKGKHKYDSPAGFGAFLGREPNCTLDTWKIQNFATQREHCFHDVQLLPDELPQWNSTVKRCTQTSTLSSYTIVPDNWYHLDSATTASVPHVPLLPPAVATSPSTSPLASAPPLLALPPVFAPPSYIVPSSTRLPIQHPPSPRVHTPVDNMSLTARDGSDQFDTDDLDFPHSPQSSQSSVTILDDDLFDDGIDSPQDLSDSSGTPSPSGIESTAELSDYSADVDFLHSAHLFARSATIDLTIITPPPPPLSYRPF